METKDRPLREVVEELDRLYVKGVQIFAEVPDDSWPHISSALLSAAEDMRVLRAQFGVAKRKGETWLRNHWEGRPRPNSNTATDQSLTPERRAETSADRARRLAKSLYDMEVRPMGEWAKVAYQILEPEIREAEQAAALRARDRIAEMCEQPGIAQIPVEELLGRTTS